MNNDIDQYPTLHFNGIILLIIRGSIYYADDMIGNAWNFWEEVTHSIL